MLVRRDGFALVEMVIVMAVLGVIAVVVGSRVSWSFGSGREDAYNSERKALQKAVDAYQEDYQKYPTYCECGLDAPNNGTPANPNDDSFVRMSLLTEGGYLKKVPRSASGANDPTGSGSYSWYVDLYGSVSSSPVFLQGTYP